MDDPKKRESAWQVDDILKELGMLDGGVSDMPSTPAPEKPEPDEVTVEFPEEQEAVVTSPEDGDETKIWPIPSVVSPKASFKEVLFTPPEKKTEQLELSIASGPDLLQQAEEPEQPEVEEEELTLKQEIFEWVKAIAISFAVVFLIFGVLIRVVTVDGNSMNPTLHNNDRLVISKLFYTPKQGDIVVLSKESGLGKALIKRVIATGGQTLDISEDGTVTINGLPLDEPYIKEKIAADMHGQHDYPVTVPSGYVFVMGDNRNDSTDSRFAVLSFVDEKYIMGRVLLRLYPLDKIGTVK